MIPLARQAVEAEVLGRPTPSFQPSTPPRAVFVTIERKGKILGCRGSLIPLEASLEAEVVHDAQSATAHDPRYKPIQPGDLADYLVTVTVVQSMSPISDIATLLPSEGLVLK